MTYYNFHSVFCGLFIISLDIFDVHQGPQGKDSKQVTDLKAKISFGSNTFLLNWNDVVDKCGDFLVLEWADVLLSTTYFTGCLPRRWAVAWGTAILRVLCRFVLIVSLHFFFYSSSFERLANVLVFEQGIQNTIFYYLVRDPFILNQIFNRRLSEHMN